LVKGLWISFRSNKITKNFPRHETYGLIQQIRKAAISLPSNIAEGYGRKHKAEYQQFLVIAYASLLELETQYLLSLDLNYMNKNEIIENLIKEVGSMLYRMIYPIRYTLNAVCSTLNTI